MYSLKLVLCSTLVASVKPNEWCYTGCDDTPEHWKDLDGSHCGESNQSPIDIVTSIVTEDTRSKDFNFVKFESTNAIKNITNNGHSVQCNIKENELEVSGGGLSDSYSVSQFHFHWGTDNEGSEHTVDDHRYPMEMHIVTGKKDVSPEERLNQKDGLAVLGFFINAKEDGEMSKSWDDLTSYLKDITEKGNTLDVKKPISINDSIKDVDLSKYYRYTGSLTTPKCNEAVVWTSFHEPIQVHKESLQRFSTMPKIKNNYRPVQLLNGRKVTASPATPSPPAWCYDDHCDHPPSGWADLPNSHCGGENQSPIDIATKGTRAQEHSTSFIFTNFDDKAAIKSVTNTGHTVEFVLKEGLVEVSGGGSQHTYSALQFHFHWGNETAESEGSEHTSDSKRFPMEMHIVTKRKDLTKDEALKHSDGLAVSGFFIEFPHSTKSSSHPENSDDSDHGDTEAPTSSTTSNKEAWKKSTHYLSSIKNINAEVDVTDQISIDDLLGDVNRESYFRYNGSSTTPMCNEAVVWTVFKESIMVDHESLQHFPMETNIRNNYRPVQPLNDRNITTSTETVAWCYDDHCDHSPTHWADSVNSHCDSKSQSPIDIDSKSAIADEHLTSFTFTNFDNKGVIKSITNTGHTVKCVLKDDMDIEVSGGGLDHTYSALQFHFHWGDESADSKGSEHTSDSKRFPMEMHIVHKRKDLTSDEALKHSDGSAVSGFFIEPPQSAKSSSHSDAPDHGDTGSSSSTASNTEAWTKSTHFSSSIKTIGAEVEFTEEISIDDLLGDVNRESYFRYSGSSTTPMCNEAVVWTVFKESVRVDHESMAMFPENAGYHNVFRPRQSLHNREVHTTASATVPGPVLFYLSSTCLFAFFLVKIHL